MSQTVADVLVGLLQQIGVRHIFGLIGDSLNPLAEVRRSKIEWISVRHKEGAALAQSSSSCAGVRLWRSLCGSGWPALLARFAKAAGAGETLKSGES